MRNMKPFIAVLLGSAVGGLLRYFAANFFYAHFGKVFPWGTLIVNLIGCFLIGLTFTLIIEQFHHHSLILHSLLITGFLGGFTTFSAFSFEAVSMFESFLYIRGLLYIFASLLGCLSLTALGIWLGKLIS